MNPPEKDTGKGGAFRTYPGLARLVAVKRFLARLVLFAERLIPLFLPPLGIAAIFVSLGWLGVYRLVPDIPRLALVFLLIFAFVAAFLPFTRLRWPRSAEADRMLEERNRLLHQPVAVQEDMPAFDTPFARALWEEHQRRMARQIADLDAGLPQPDISRFDRYALRTVPVLLLVTAYAFSGSNNAGSVLDAFRLHRQADTSPAMRLDAWITPPSYTGRAPIFLTGRDDQVSPAQAVPQYSLATIRITGTGTEAVSFIDEDGNTADITPQENEEPGAALPRSGQTSARTFAFKIEANGILDAAGQQWSLNVVPDKAPEIAFDGTPQSAVNGALEIPFIARDDYGLQQAHAEIVPADPGTEGAIPLYPAPDYKLDLSRNKPREAKGRTSRNFTEHPLAGKKVRITLVATDGAGQTGRSQPVEMVMPARHFSEALAAAVAEQRQAFALDTRDLPKAIALNEALTIRPDETIPNLTHFLLIESALIRMKLSRTDEHLRDTAEYLWDIAIGIEDGDLSLAERRLRDAQQKLAEALENGASDEEIKKLMDELRAAMDDFLREFAERQQGAPSDLQQQAQNLMSQRDLNSLLDQLENLARSGNRDAAQQLLSELQRLMNNLQAGRPQQGGQQQTSEMRQQIDKLGELMQQQQQLMNETFRLDQALKDRMQRGDPQPGESDERQDGQQGPPTDQMTAEQLREALKQLQEQQQGLGQQLQELQEALKGMGIQPGDQFGQAQREMEGAGDALGKSQGSRAVEGQGRALEALRQGARNMMGQIMQAMRGQQGQGRGEGMTGQGDQNGRDPLGRPRSTTGPDFGGGLEVPDEIDVQTARRILESIREKLGTIRERLQDNSGSEIERQYLERLLNVQ